MEQYRLSIKKRIALEALLAAVVVTVALSSLFGLIPSAPGERFGDFMQGFLLGLSGTVVVFFIIGTVTKINLLRKEEKLRIAYIKENDERAKYIAAKSGGSVMYVSGIIILVAAIVAGYFSSIVFFTLLACSMFLLLIIIVMSGYYGSKY